MKKTELEEIRRLAAAIVTKTYNIKEEVLVSKEQLDDIRSIPYESLVKILEEKQKEHIKVTDDDIKELRKKYQEIYDDITEEVEGFMCKQDEIAKMCNAVDWNPYEEITGKSILDHLDNLFEISLKEIKNRSLSYYFTSGSGWNITIDVRLKDVIINFTAYNSIEMNW